MYDAFIFFAAKRAFNEPGEKQVVQDAVIHLYDDLPGDFVSRLFQETKHGESTI